MDLKSQKIGLAISIIIFFVVVWDYDVMDYIKNLVVLFHELSHATAALITGGKVKYISIHGNQSGETAIIQNNYSISFFFVTSAGYLGSSLIGAILLNRGFAGKFEKESLFIIGLFIFFMVYNFSCIGNLAYTIGIAWSVIFIVISLLSRFFAAFCLVFIGTTVSLYSIYDLIDFTRDINQTDAWILSIYIFRLFNLSETTISHQKLGYLIASFWSFISISIIYCIVRRALRSSKSIVDKSVLVFQKQILESKVKPDVVGWFVSRGLDLDGRPLSKEVITKIRRKRN